MNGMQRNKLGKLIDHFVIVDGYTVDVNQPNAKLPVEQAPAESSSSQETPQEKLVNIRCKIGQCGLRLSDFELVQAGHRSAKLSRAIKAFKGKH
jgi:hypothetical protein